jgi:hypothetical protein
MIGAVFGDAHKKVCTAEPGFEPQRFLKIGNGFFVAPLFFTNQAQVQVAFGKVWGFFYDGRKAFTRRIDISRPHCFRSHPELFNNFGGNLRGLGRGEQRKRQEDAGCPSEAEDAPAPSMLKRTESKKKNKRLKHFHSERPKNDLTPF